MKIARALRPAGAAHTTMQPITIQLRYNSRMVRLIKMFVVALVLQLTWGVASAYCMHETGPASQHFGHHEHKHEASDSSSDDADTETSSAAKLKPHPDCASCAHGQLGVPTLDTPTVPPVAITHCQMTEIAAPASPFLDMPERPQWNTAA